MSISVQRSGFTRIPELFYAIIQDLASNGFDMVFPATIPAAPLPGTDYAPFKVTLLASPLTDPLSATQPWSIQFDAKAVQYGDVYIATPLQLPSDGTVAKNEKITQNDEALPVGMLNTTGKMPDVDLTEDQTNSHFVYRSHRIKDKSTAEAYPMSYRLSITERGIALVIWEDASDNQGTRHSWMCVQRPVDRLTGAPLIVGHCPLVAVFGMNVSVPATGPAILENPVIPVHLSIQPYKFIVRENDVLRPTIPVQADQDTEDSHAIMNSINQVAITENNRYVISFPNGLNTPRYAYTEEIDMIAYTSADVVSAYTDVPITVYGEGAARTYAAMQANLPFNTGMRLLLLKVGGGIAA